MYTIFIKGETPVFKYNYNQARDIFDAAGEGNAALYPDCMPKAHTPGPDEWVDHVYMETNRRESLRKQFPGVKIVGETYVR